MLERWLGLIARVSDTANADTARAAYDDLHRRYTTATRRYHDLRHIDACLRLFDSVRHLARNADAIELAIWFHDAVYDTKRSDNEEASATLAADALAHLGVSSSMIQPVRDLILATRHLAPPADPDAALLVDIDLSILGQPAPLFDRYEQDIRFEYAWVCESDFRKGRGKVLQSFLDRARIFGTDDFHSILEAPARENLKRSLARLAT